MSDDSRFGGLDPDDAEFSSVEDLVEYLGDDDRETYTYGELNCLCYRLGMNLPKAKDLLEAWGFTLEPRAVPKSFRGVTAWDNNRWAGNPCGGGSGWKEINGGIG